MMFSLAQLPTFKETITLLHKTDNGYVSKVIKNCSVYEVDQLNNNGLDTSTKSVRAVDIPCPVDVSEDDYIFFGSVSVDTSNLIKEAREKNAMKIKTVQHNDRFIGQHMHCEE